MPKMIQVRNVPDRLHKELVKRAKIRGQTLSAFIEGLLEREVERPPAEEIFERVHHLPRVQLPRPVADYIREERMEPSAPSQRMERSDSLSAEEEGSHLHKPRR